MMLLVCDLDGVVWRGAELIGSVGAPLREFVEQGNEIVFLTNNSYLPVSQIKGRLRSIIESEKFALITSPMAVASLIDGGNTAWVLGEQGLIETLRDSGIHIERDPREADYVVLGLTRAFNYESIVDAMSAIRRGARFIAANVDPTYPTEHGPMPGAGPLVAAIECAAGVEAIIAGKPSVAMSTLVGRHLGRHSEVVLVGDRIDQDYGTALHLQCDFILIDEAASDDDGPEPFRRLPSLNHALSELMGRI